MDSINLAGTRVEEQYLGAGDAFLLLENDQPSKLIYENPKCTPVRVNLSDDELFQLFVDNGIDFDTLDKKDAVILMGTCSCYQFVFPEVFIDFREDGNCD
jgi:hypothetical protein